MWQECLNVCLWLGGVQEYKSGSVEEGIRRVGGQSRPLIPQRDRTVAAQTVTNWSVSSQYGCGAKQRGTGRRCMSFRERCLRPCLRPGLASHM